MLIPGSLVTKLGTAKNIMINVQTTFPDLEPVLAFTGRNNFRKRFSPTYKANRKTMIKPTGLPEILGWLTDNYDSVTFDWLEADDILGSYMSQGATAISSDKDMETCPGKLYNRKTKKIHFITEEEANFNFWMQMLTGDPTDNVRGCPGIGKKRAYRALCEVSEGDLYPTVAQLYEDHFSNSVQAAAELNTNGHVLYIKRYWDEDWKTLTCQL